MKRLMITLLLACLLPLGALAQLPRMGVCGYSSTDTFIGSMVAQLQQQAEGKALLSVAYADSDQNIQNDQVLKMLDEGAQVMLVNPVDRTSAIYLMELCHQRGVPLILFNRQPLQEDLDSYPQAYYVGIDPKQQGRMQAELIMAYFRQNPQQDINGDGIVQYVLLRGEPGHQDAELRSLYMQRELLEQGFLAEKLGEDTAHWDKALGQERMAALLSSFGRQIECVVSNNDDMALGAIDALKAAGYLGRGRGMPVVGVDATQPALEMIRQGGLYGTVRNDAATQARAQITLALLLAEGLEVNADNYAFPMDNKLVYIASEAITKATLEADEASKD